MSQSAQLGGEVAEEGEASVGETEEGGEMKGGEGVAAVVGDSAMDIEGTVVTFASVKTAASTFAPCVGEAFGGSEVGSGSGEGREGSKEGAGVSV